MKAPRKTAALIFASMLLFSACNKSSPTADKPSPAPSPTPELSETAAPSPDAAIDLEAIDKEVQKLLFENGSHEELGT